MLEKPPCEECTAACCKENRHDYAVELEETEKDFHFEFKHNGMEVVRVIPYVNGQCFYLIGNKCSIYDRRPLLCRQFNCSTNYPERISFFLDDNPEVLKLVQLTIKKQKEIAQNKTRQNA
jgi:Fe-S-cluster containining protein